MDLLDQSGREVTAPELIFIVKKFAHLWDMPLRMSIVPRNTTIKIKKLEEVNLEQL